MIAMVPANTSAAICETSSSVSAVSSLPVRRQYSRTSSESGTGTEPQKTHWVAGLIVKMAMMMFVIFIAFCARVHLNDKTEQLAREKARILEEIREKRTEIQTLVAKRESLRSWDNINKKINQYNLALRAVNPSQVRYMKRFEGQVAAPSQYGGDTRVADTSAGAALTSGGIQ